MSVELLPNFIGGEWVPSTGTEKLPVLNPATAEVLAEVPLSTREDVDRAVAAAKEAFPAWRRTPPVERARCLFKLKNLIVDHFDEVSAILTREHGKNLIEARGSLRRGMENVEHACGIPTLMLGDSLEDVAAGIDSETFRQPLGVFAGIAPFNFPAMVPLWFWPYAAATGNCYILKPSEQVPLTQKRLFELAAEAGFPPGVLNLVNGAREVVEGILEHPDIVGVSFVGSSPVARLVYQRAGETGKRVQSLGGAKNYMVVMPDADVAGTVDNIIGSAFGNAGQRCLAGSVLVMVGDAHEKLVGPIVDAAKKLTIGNGLEDGIDLGPVISAAARDRIVGYIDAAEKAGAKVLLDGRDPKVPAGCEKGFFVGPTIFDEVTPDMPLACEEVFGPVIAIRRAKDLDEAIAMVREIEFANATSIFTSSGKAARQFKYEIEVTMIGVNVGVAAPMAFFPFGGTKGSFFGDTKAHGHDAVRFFTDAKVVISRWY